MSESVTADLPEHYQDAFRVYDDTLAEVVHDPLALTYVELIMNTEVQDKNLEIYQAVRTPTEELVAETLKFPDSVKYGAIVAKNISNIRPMVDALNEVDLESASNVTSQIWDLLVNSVFACKNDRAEQFLREEYPSKLMGLEVVLWNHLVAFMFLKKTVDQRLVDMEYQQRLKAAHNDSAPDSPGQISYHRGLSTRTAGRSRVVPKTVPYGETRAFD